MSGFEEMPEHSRYLEKEAKAGNDGPSIDFLRKLNPNQLAPEHEHGIKEEGHPIKNTTIFDGPSGGVDWEGLTTMHPEPREKDDDSQPTKH